VVCGPPVNCPPQTGRATRTPQTTKCLQVVSGPSVTCTCSGVATAHRIPQSVCSLTRATCSQSARATRCVLTACSLAPAPNPQSNPCGTGTAVRKQSSCTPCTPVSRAVCGPVSSCGATHGTRTAVTCGGSCVPIVKSPTTGQATRTPQCLGTVCTPVVHGPTVQCSTTGHATRTSCVPTGCQPIPKVQQPNQCGTSTATRTPCTPKGTIKTIRQPSCSGIQSSGNETGSCSSTAEDTPSCG
jgi:hypothetical protein